MFIVEEESSKLHFVNDAGRRLSSKLEELCGLSLSIGANNKKTLNLDSNQQKFHNVDSKKLKRSKKLDNYMQELESDSQAFSL